MTLLRISVLAVALAGALALLGLEGAERASGRLPTASASTAAGRMLMVTGTGAVTAVPNRATFSFGVTSEAKTAAAALEVRLGAVRSITESSAGPVPVLEKAAATDTPIEPGSQQIQAIVTVDFALR
jgi:uncharacterized protein YggE